MKKKFIAVSMVLGALALSSTTLTSCVDDNESASVTAIRDAKAQQLASVAALNNAQAKAQELRAQAEADLAAAKAAYKQALADQEASEAEFLAEKYKAQLEALKAKYEAQIIQQQEEASSSEQTMWSNLNKTLTNLAKYYTDALSEVKTLNEEIFNAEYKLANAEVNQESANAVAQQLINNLNTQITAKTAQIERLKTQVGDKDALYKQMNDLVNQAYKLINTDKPAADDAKAAAEKAYEEAYAPIDYTKINNNGNWADNHEKLEWEKTALPYIFAVDTLKQIEDHYTTPEIFKTATETVDAPEGCYSTTADNITTWVLKEGSAYLEATQKTVNAINANIKTKEDALGKATDAATGSSLYALLNKADAEKKAADAALAADPTNAGLKQDAEAKAVALMKAQEDVADGIEELTEAQNELKSYNNAIAALTKDSEQQKAYAAAVAKAVEAKENELAKAHEVHVIESAIETIGIKNFNTDGTVNTSTSDSEYDIAKALYEGTTTAEEAILELEKDIADYKKQLTEVGSNGRWESEYIQIYDPTLDYDGDGTPEGGIVEKQALIYISTGVLTIEQTKQLLQMEIDNLKAELEVANSLVAQYKTALENAIQNMNGDDVEVPTTPAEEETPAE